MRKYSCKLVLWPCSSVWLYLIIYHNFNNTVYWCRTDSPFCSGQRDPWESAENTLIINHCSLSSNVQSAPSHTKNLFRLSSWIVDIYSAKLVILNQNKFAVSAKKLVLWILKLYQLCWNVWRFIKKHNLQKYIRFR